MTGVTAVGAPRPQRREGPPAVPNHGRVPIGAHVSISGHIYDAIPRAQAIGCECLQIFVGSPRQWRLVEYPAGRSRGVPPAPPGGGAGAARRPRAVPDQPGRAGSRPAPPLGRRPRPHRPRHGRAPRPRRDHAHRQRRRARPGPRPGGGSGARSGARCATAAARWSCSRAAPAARSAAGSRICGRSSTRSAAPAARDLPRHGAPVRRGVGSADAARRRRGGLRVRPDRRRAPPARPAPQRLQGRARIAPGPSREHRRGMDRAGRGSARCWPIPSLGRVPGVIETPGFARTGPDRKNVDAPQAPPSGRCARRWRG